MTVVLVWLGIGLGIALLLLAAWRRTAAADAEAITAGPPLTTSGTCAKSGPTSRRAMNSGG